MSADVLGILLLSLKVSAGALIWALPLGYLLGFVLARFEFRGKSLVSALVMLPLVMPPVATGLLLLYGFGPNGPIGWLLGLMGIRLAFTAAGAALAAGLVALPLIVRPIRLSLEAVDPALEDALAVAGHGSFRRFLMLALPLSLPGVVAGAVLGFAKGLGEFGATITFAANIPGETQTLSLAIHSALQRVDGGWLVLILCLVSVAISLIAVLGSEALLRVMTPWLTGRQEPIRA